MCGLVGVFGDVNEKAKKAFSILHMLDVLRGRDGAGFYYKQHEYNKKGCLLKVDSIPDDISYLYDDKFDTSQYLFTLKETNLSLILGHNRASTTGSVKEENSHPFEFSRIVGAHNGTLQPHSIRNIVDEEHEVDSKTLFHSINDMSEGIHKTFKSFSDIINKVTGAMTLTWYDKKANTLMFFRNDQRPLYWTYNKDKTQLYWASESWMLAVALNRLKIEFNDIKSVPANTLFELKCKKKKNNVRIILVGSKLIEKVYIPPKYYYPNARTSWIDYPQTRVNHKTGFEKASYILYGDLLTKKEFDYRMRHGCAWCSTSISYSERLEVGFLDRTTVLCPNCIKDDSFNELFATSGYQMERGKDVH